MGNGFYTKSYTTLWTIVDTQNIIVFGAIFGKNIKKIIGNYLAKSEFCFQNNMTCE